MALSRRRSTENVSCTLNVKRLQIQSLSIILAVGIFLLVSGSISGCSAAIRGKVVDAETGEPVEGAVVLAEWTVTKGFGLTYTESYKILETVTDNEGKFRFSRVYNPFAGGPTVVIYKKGYVAWRNDYIFPGWKKREHFRFKRGLIITLELFQEGYSQEEHLQFIGSGIVGANLTDAPEYSAAESEILTKALEEVEIKKMNDSEITKRGRDIHKY